MNRIGRRRTALLGDALAALGLLTAYFAGGEGLAGYFAGFGLLGIGCTAIQVSVNPMLAMLAPRDRMSVYLTLGQVFRNTALLLLAPVVTLLVWLAGSWELLLPLYALLTVAGGLWMAFTRFDDPAMNAPSAERVDLKGYLGLMKNGTVALCALSIGAFLMLDVGIGYLSVQLVDSPNPLLTTTFFYACRIAGSLAGVWILSRVDDLKYLCGCMAVAALVCVSLFSQHAAWVVYAGLGLLGFVLACVFATFFAAATRAVPERANEVSGLMILMISAGALSAPVIGAIVRHSGDVRSGVWFLLLCVLFIGGAACYLKKRKG